MARLSRLDLDEKTLLTFGKDLLQILQHMETLADIDTEEVEPMARPHDAVNRLDEDEPEPPLQRETLLQLAPEVEFPFISVPKVLQEGGG